MPVIFIIFELILKNDKYTFIELIIDDAPDNYILYKDNSNGKGYIWPIEIGGIYVNYVNDNNILKIEYNKILCKVVDKLQKYDKYKNNVNEFLSKENLVDKFASYKVKEWIVRSPLISLFPINKRICKYEMLRILKYIKTIASNKKDEKYTDVLEELKNTDVNKAKIRFFYFNSFYCDSIIFLLSEKTNFQKTHPANTLRIKFKNNGDEYSYKNIKDLGIYAYYYTEEEKKIIKDVIKVLKYKRNILNKKDNKIKNIYCKNNGDIESIELINY